MLQSGTEEEQMQTWLGYKGYPLEIVLVNFDYSDKYHRYKQEKMENMTFNILWDFEIKIIDTIQSRKPDLGIVVKKEGTY